MAFCDVPIENVDISSAFWSRTQRCTRERTIPAIIEAQKSANHWQCLTWKEDHHIKPHPFWDSDVYKVVEAACYFMLKHPDTKMMATVEEAVDMIRNAQHPDGYINSYYTVHGLGKRWTNLRDMHELYCLGHLIEATVAYETLTKSGRLMEPVMKAIKHVNSVFGLEEGKKRGYPGHEEIELGLLRLYELNGDALLLQLAQYFILERGQRDQNDETYFDHEARARGGDPYEEIAGAEVKSWAHGARDYGYAQADRPFIQATEVKGHAVRAMYFFTAATDLVRLTGNKEVKAALDRMWRDLVDHKLYITGGIGSVRQWEGFGPAYTLGDTEADGSCYAETCASFALINWCQRMLRLNLKSEYGDVMETALYNGFLGAVGLEGESFYYTNPLRTMTGQPKARSKWFGVACCPPNVAKLLSSMGSLIYSFREDLVAIHLYIESELRVPGTDIVVTQKTNMPWIGDVEITVTGTTEIGLALRIPGWARGYSCSTQGEENDGYLFIPPCSNACINLQLPLQARKVYAHPRTNKDEMCIVRGPLVYCIEDVDNNDIDVDNIALLDTSLREGSTTMIASVEQVVPVIAQGKRLEMNEFGSLYGSKPWKFRSSDEEIVAVPFFLRANRGGKGGMRVWTKRLDAPLTNGYH